jgi:hypothetical protein
MRVRFMKLFNAISDTQIALSPISCDQANQGLVFVLAVPSLDMVDPSFGAIKPDPRA